jgi:CTP:molybdopterin cytidylyltransferase MocA
MNFAVVPAAGLSTRMGRPKLALPLGPHTILEQVVVTLRAGGVQHILVVIGPHVPELAALATTAGADVLALTEPTPDMRATVERGLAWLELHYQPQPDDCWFLAPGDHPHFTAAVVRELLQAATEAPHSLIVPVCQGRRGHPTLLRWHHTAGLRNHPTHEGINSYLRLHTATTLELPVSEPGIHVNLDTPEDYQRLRQSGGGH